MITGTTDVKIWDFHTAIFVYDPSAVKPDVAQDGLPTGLVNEARISQIVREIIKNKLQ